MSYPVDPPELRRLAQAARRSIPWATPFDTGEAKYVAAVPPDVVLALLDRIDALTEELDEARRLVRTALAFGEDERHVDLIRQLYNDLIDLLAPDPGAVAGEPESEETT